LQDGQVDDKGGGADQEEGQTDLTQGEESDPVPPAPQVVDLKQAADVHQDQGQC
jgi:hypothetical protein